jgi:hypothetical protein
VPVAEGEAGALHEDQGDLFFTTSVENREYPLYLALSTLETTEGPHELPLGDTPEPNFKQARLIHCFALPEEYRDPSTEAALAQ